jgi:hypothetical protein
MNVRHSAILIVLCFGATVAHGDASVGAIPAAVRQAPLEKHELIDGKTCITLLPALTSVNRCWLGRSAGGAAALLWVEHGCDNNGCPQWESDDDNRVWILVPGSPPRALPAALGWEGTTVLQSLAEAIVDDGRGHLARVDLRRRDLIEGKRFAACAEPVQSPSARWIVCRNRQADVLRIPISGGRLERVFRHRGIFYPGAHGTVEFVSPSSMSVPYNMTGDCGTDEVVPWRE